MWKTMYIAALSLLLVSAGQPADREKPKDSGRAAVSIKDRKFTPATVTIKKGQAVVWTNNDDMDHTVNADNGSFSSGTIKKKGTFEQTFKAAGRFPYSCKLHPREKGTVVVQ
jgi:plastocyanin